MCYGNSSNQDCKALQRVLRLAERISGSALPSLKDIYFKRCKSRAAKILKDSTHPGNHLFCLLPSGKHFRSMMAKTECNKVRKKEGSGQGWLVKTRVLYCTQINLNRCALCASSVHQLSRLSQRSLSVFVLAVSRTQTMRPSLHSVFPRMPAPWWLYLVSPRQLLQSDTGGFFFSFCT